MSLGWHNIDRDKPVSDDPLNTGLVAWYKAIPSYWGGYDTWFDLCRRNNGKLVNMAAPTSGPSLVAPQGGFGSMLFDGVNDYVESPLEPSGTLAGVSFGGRLRYDVPSMYGMVMSYGVSDTEAPDAVPELRQSAGSGSMSVIKTSDNNGPVSAVLTGTGWHHVMAVVTPTSWSLYVDAILVGTTTGVINLVAPNPAPTFRLGARGDGTGLFYAGWLDDMQFFYRALTQPQIAALTADSMLGCPRTLRRIRRRAYSIPAAGGNSIFRGSIFQSRIIQGVCA